MTVSPTANHTRLAVQLLRHRSPKLREAGVGALPERLVGLGAVVGPDVRERALLVAELAPGEVNPGASCRLQARAEAAGVLGEGLVADGDGEVRGLGVLQHPPVRGALAAKAGVHLVLVRVDHRVDALLGRDGDHRLDTRDVVVVHLAVGATVILLHPPLHPVDVSIGMERACHQNGSLADGRVHLVRALRVHARPHHT